MNTYESLVETAKNNPHDVTPRNVLADFLDDDGKPEEAEKWRSHLACSLYPDMVTTDHFYGPSDYTPIIEYCGTILIRVDDSDYQGTTRVLLKNGNRYGFLAFGWGSCSGCDQLQACDDLKEIDEVIRSIAEDVKWFDSLDEVKAYVRAEHGNPTNEWRSADEEWRDFCSQVENYIDPRPQ